MNWRLLALRAALTLGVAVAAGAAQAEAAVSIEVSQPGVYGRIDIGRFPTPQVVRSRPVVIQPAPPHASRREPVYLWVPPGHRRHWARHCAGYRACGVPVYFVRDDWYDRHVRDERRGDGRRDDPRADDRGRGHDHARNGGRDDDGHGDRR